MEQLNMNQLLNRLNEEKTIKDALIDFEKNKSNLLTKRGLYIYGSPGSGKTQFVENILKDLDYDIIKFDAGDVRNKSIIETITKHNMSDKNVISMFRKKIKNIAIVMDEIDGMNSGDKGGINSLIKLIRPKKTKKQKKEQITMTPIICIGNYHIDKKIREMMKICTSIELKKPTNEQVKNLIELLMPKIENGVLTNIVEFIQGDLRKLKSTYEIYNTHQSILKNQLIQNLFQKKNYNEDTKEITKKLLNNIYKIDDHSLLMNETDRTSVALLFHENIIDLFQGKNNNEIINFYIGVLDNICFSDYIDRITFQKQIWVFNEMSSLIKTFYNNYLLHKKLKKKYKKNKYNPSDVRFTKVLTKYSTEYNNSLFFQNLCKQLNMDKKDLFSYFMNLKKNHTIDEIIDIFDNDNYEINKLDISRFYRYMDFLIGI
jgi:DNA polymerase III delta prime subunit